VVARSYLEKRTLDYTAANPILLVRLATGTVLTSSITRLDEVPANARALDAAGAQRAFLTFPYRAETYRAAVVPISDASGTVVGVFEAALPLSSTTAIANRLLWTLAIAGSAIVFLGALLSAFGARATLAPLRQAAATADRVTHAHLTERIAYDRPGDEVGRLVTAVNAMLDRLEAAFGEQRRFLADASHELRTPLAIIGGHLEMIRDGGLVPGENAEEVSVLSDEVGRMSRLVDDMLGLARLDAGAPRPFQPLDVRALLHEAAGRGRMLDTDRTFRVEAPEGLWIHGDPDQLLQAVLNLVSNAVNNTLAGGRITLTATAKGGEVIMRVEDNGVGLRAEDIDRLFDRFYRSRGPRGAGGGSGLGLAIVKRLVELHGGTIAAGNRRSGGAVFTIRLPQSQPPR
jgi:two-component system OmpR family sensor kinase